MLKDVLDRIDERLKAMGLKESKAATLAGLSDSAIRNIRRAVKDGKENQGISIKTLEKLAPVLDTTPGWLLEGGAFISARVMERLTKQIQLLPMDDLEDDEVDELANNYAHLAKEKLKRIDHKK